MAYENELSINLDAGEDLVVHRFVQVTSGELKYADAGDEPVGLTADTYDDGDAATAKPLRGGVMKVTANGAISSGSALYVANDGKVSDSAVGTQIGIALAATTADGGKMPAIVWGPRGGSDALSAKGKTVEIFDDFFGLDTVTWASTDDGGTGSNAVADGAGGLVNVVTAAADNDYHLMASASEPFKFAANKSLWFEARFSLTEANTDDANWVLGLTDTLTTGFLADDGAGPPASYDGAVFFKVDGTMKIQFESSNAGTQVTNATLADFASGTTYRLGFLFDPGDGTTGTVTPFVNGTAGTAHNITLAGLEEMHLVYGVKAGDTNAETLQMDYIHCVQER